MSLGGSANSGMSLGGLSHQRDSLGGSAISGMSLGGLSHQWDESGGPCRALLAGKGSQGTRGGAGALPRGTDGAEGSRAWAGGEAGGAHLAIGVMSLGVSAWPC